MTPERLTGWGVALFLDIDGVVSKVGASRIDDRGQLAGENLFEWWPQLRQVLDEHPAVRVVIHSSWGRLFGPLEFLRPLLPDGLAARVEAITDMNESRRAHAVQAWVDAHAGELGAYVVLDDKDDFPSHMQLVQCDPLRGLSDPAKLEELRNALASAYLRARAGK